MGESRLYKPIQVHFEIELYCLGSQLTQTTGIKTMLVQLMLMPKQLVAIPLADRKTIPANHKAGKNHDQAMVY